MAWGASPLAGRVTAAAQALGAPKTSIPTKGIAKAGKTPAGRPPSKAPAKTPPRSTAAPAPRQVPNYTEGALNESQIKGLEKGYEQKLLAGERAAYQPALREINQNELGASERYGQASQTSNSLLASLAAQQEASAKTFENQAADSALQQAKTIETSGQNQTSMTGGYMSPELKAEMQAEGQREAGAGATGNTFAQNSAQASGNLLAALRGTAALRATEGQGRITDTFQKQTANVQGKELAAVPKVAAEAASYGSKIAAENEKAYATNQGLGLKTQLAANTVSATRSKETRERAAEREGSRKLGISEAKLGIERARGQSTAEYQHADAQYKLMTAQDKKAYDEAQAQYKHYQEQHGGTTKGPSVAEANKYAASLSTVQALAAAALGNTRTKAAYEKARNEIYTKNAGKISTEVLQAGLNLAYYGHLMGTDVQNAYSHGLSPSLRPAWFKGK
jgi:hypothetical protein